MADPWPSLTELARGVASGDTPARELVERSARAIEAHRDLNAWASVDVERALADAAAIDAAVARGEDVGPLAGVPIAVKDMEHAAGFVTGLGSRLTDGDAPQVADSALVARLRAAGCVVVGKTTTSEQGYKGDTVSPKTGATRNPIDPARSAGGSSGGTAVALATAMVPLGTGSDGGGSIRIPASICGLTGFKPTNGLVPLGGPDAPGAGLLAVRAPMAATAADIAVALAACTGLDRSDPFTFPSPQFEPLEPRLPARVAWCWDFGSPVDRDVLVVCQAAIGVLEAAGCEIVEVTNPFRVDPVDVFRTLWTSYRNRAQGHLRGTPAWELIDAGLRADMDHGATLDGETVTRAFDAIWTLAADVECVLAGSPFLLSPTVGARTGLVGRLGTIDGVESDRWVSFTQALNLARHPAGTVRCGVDPDGLPVGLQVIGGAHRDSDVLGVLGALESLFADAPVSSPR